MCILMRTRISLVASPLPWSEGDWLRGHFPCIVTALGIGVGEVLGSCPSMEWSLSPRLTVLVEQVVL